MVNLKVCLNDFCKSLNKSKFLDFQRPLKLSTNFTKNRCFLQVFKDFVENFAPQKKRKILKRHLLSQKFAIIFKPKIVKKPKKGYVMRDYNIILSFKKEVDMVQKQVKSKKVYSRKIKHKRAYYEKESLY